MRIFFGMQGTGNGHPSRARDLVREGAKFVDGDVPSRDRQHALSPLPGVAAQQLLPRKPDCACLPAPSLQSTTAQRVISG
jgi:hypothetical protein